jgi:hypothetical protein
MTYYLVCFNFDCNCIIELKNILRTLKRMMVYASSVLHFYKSAFVVKENENWQEKALRRNSWPYVLRVRTSNASC